jgi:protein SPT2
VNTSAVKGGTTTAVSGSKPAGSDRNKPLATKTIPTRPAPKPSNDAPPKKRSFAEIMQRAKTAQETIAKAPLGKIQHKTIERGMSMKERKELKAQEARKAKKGARHEASGRSAGPGVPRNGSNGADHRNGTSSTPFRKTVTARDKNAPVVEEKKVKKAALATTGYTGTARPRPGSSSTKAGAASSRPTSDSKHVERSGYGNGLSSRRYKRYEEDEMDDFIEYDEEEDEPGYGRRRGYDSLDEDESDMEAGMSDIDNEERVAELQARREDQEQELLEKKLKREKEERKRQYLAGR